MTHFKSAERLILASGSAIRAQIMDGAGLDYKVISKPVDEAAIKEAMLAEGARLRDVADALAEAKALRERNLKYFGFGLLGLALASIFLIISSLKRFCFNCCTCDRN